ncbi:Poly(A) RNA polymerase gld-2 homolog A [Eumeta japonica]|uniref:Poly(A) RNA polymerase gld-2 homolog A n=1 Tax=Eumeta variegata TaxID=151549 RepID=A0A4C1XHQ6_EUMVA|nr:Poly(A) RNA polymerase gld-2 homolog A [Eumeta japonica]
MNEEMTTMYHGGNGLGKSPATYTIQNQMERSGPRQCPLEVLQYMGNTNTPRNCTYGPNGQNLPRRPQPRKDRLQKNINDGTAFGYDSDDSSLSSNASGSAKSSEKGDTVFHASDVSNGNTMESKTVREWRGRPRRELRPRRIAPDRYLHAAYGYQVKFAPDDLLNDLYCQQLMRLKQKVEKKRPEFINRKGVVFHHHNAIPHLLPLGKYLESLVGRGSKWDTLSQELWDKFVTSQQTEDTFRKKMLVWRYLYITVKSVYPRYGLYVVGSTMSGFGLDSSDMDLCLFVRPAEDMDSRTSAIIHLGYILNYVRNVDSMDWRVRPLVVITKLWARAHNINDARQRTLSSYSLTLMVIHFLQHGTSPAVLPCVCVRAAWWEYAGGAAAARWPTAQRSLNRQSLGELFAALLHYYGSFPYDKMAVSVRIGRPVPVSECRAARSYKNDPQQWKYLCVEEPFDLTNTARSVYDPESFEKIVNAFKESHQRLAAGVRLADAWPR